MKKAFIFLFFTLLSVATFAQPVKESTKLKKDSVGVYRERTLLVKEYLPDTAILKDQMLRIQVEIDTLQSRLKKLRQEIKDWKKAKDGPITPGAAPNNAPRSEESTPTTPISIPNPDANKPPVKPKKKNR